MSRHDRVVLDALEVMQPETFAGEVWRVAARGRDPLRGSAAPGRWSASGAAEVLYTSLEKDGALAEIGYRLSLEPVWPSRLRHDMHRIGAQTARTLRFETVPSLAAFGVDPARYGRFDYAATQAVASAAQFLGFDALIVPSARSPALNLVVFLEPAGETTLTLLDSAPVDWAAWRSRPAGSAIARQPAP